MAKGSVYCRTICRRLRKWTRETFIRKCELCAQKNFFYYYITVIVTLLIDFLRPLLRMLYLSFRFREIFMIFCYIAIIVVVFVAAAVKLITCFQMLM